MDPIMLSLIISGLAEGTKYVFELSKLLDDCNEGKVDKAEADRRYYAIQAAHYIPARAGWDAAGKPKEQEA